MSEKQKQMISNATPRWYRKMKVWALITAVLTTIATGEAISYFKNLPLPIWVHSVIGVCGFMLILTKIFIKDVNNDGLVD